MRSPFTVTLILAAVLAACQNQDEKQRPVPDSSAETAVPVAPAPATGTSSAVGTGGAGAEAGGATFTAHDGEELPDLGIPIYPGAHALAGGTWKMRDKHDEGADALTAFTLFTPHKLDSVVEFYRGQLRVEPGAIFTLKARKGRTVSITVETGNHTVNLLLHESADPQGTRIEVSAMSAPRQVPPT